MVLLICFYVHSTHTELIIIGVVNIIFLTNFFKNKTKSWILFNEKYLKYYRIHLTTQEVLQKVFEFVYSNSS